MTRSARPWTLDARFIAGWALALPFMAASQLGGLLSRGLHHVASLAAISGARLAYRVVAPLDRPDFLAALSPALRARVEQGGGTLGPLYIHTSEPRRNLSAHGLHMDAGLCTLEAPCLACDFLDALTPRMRGRVTAQNVADGRVLVLARSDRAMLGTVERCEPRPTRAAHRHRVYWTARSMTGRECGHIHATAAAEYLLDLSGKAG